MSFFNARRLSAIVLAALLAILLPLSPLLDAYGEHNHSCSPSKCGLCNVSAVLSRLRDICAIASALTVCAIAAFRLICAGLEGFGGRRATPILLKVKIVC